MGIAVVVGRELRRRIYETRNWRTPGVCRNIKTLFNFDPPASDEEVRAAAEQFVRKLSGFAKPSRANAKPFSQAVEEVTRVARRLLDTLETNAAPKDREIEAARARARNTKRFGKGTA